MAFSVKISASTGDCVVLQPNGVDEFVRLTPEQEISERFGLKVGEFSIFQDEDGLLMSAKSEGVGAERVWQLNKSFPHVLTRSGFPETVAKISQQVEEPPATPIQKGQGSTFQSNHLNASDDKDCWKDEFLVSVVESILQGIGKSRCVEAARLLLRDTDPERVQQLPDFYDGDHFFELPPYTGASTKGSFFLGMERRNDCYLWSRMIDTSAQIGAKLNNLSNAYKIGNVKCLGSLECQNADCLHYERNKRRNCDNWTRDKAGKNEAPFTVGKDVPEGSVLCAFCERPPRCIDGCRAEMWYITPSNKIPIERYRHLSRAAMHVGKHTHPAMFNHSKQQRLVVRNLMEEQIRRSPNAKPAIIKSETIKALQDILGEKVATMVSLQEASDLEETLAILSDRSEFRSMIRSIKRYTPTTSDLTTILELKASTLFPFVQSVLIPFQNVGTDERPHVFKMSTKGPGSGIDLVRRMQPGGDLEFSWVMSDVMHRHLDQSWCTMSAHVYDHFYRGLCTIFVCELTSEDTSSLQTAWKVMKRVCAQNNIQDVKFSGFMADNAQAGWNAIRNEFFDGRVNSHKERSDSFHWAQSVERMKKYIVQDKRTEHKERLESLRDAGNIILAFRIFESIKRWWSEGNAIEGTLIKLTTWLSWWIV